MKKYNKWNYELEEGKYPRWIHDFKIWREIKLQLEMLIFISLLGEVVFHVIVQNSLNCL